VNVLNNLAKYYPVGSRLVCAVLDKAIWQKRRLGFIGRRRSNHHHLSNHEDQSAETKSSSGAPILSLLASTDKTMADPSKPCAGDLVVGRIDRSLPCVNAPDLLLNFRGGYIGRCCITELEEVDDWTNFPLGRSHHPHSLKDVAKDNSKFMEEEGVDDADREQQVKMYVHHSIIPWVVLHQPNNRTLSCLVVILLIVLRFDCAKKKSLVPVWRGLTLLWTLGSR
jgi:hypothetical protein